MHSYDSVTSGPLSVSENSTLLHVIEDGLMVTQLLGGWVIIAVYFESVKEYFVASIFLIKQ